VAVFALPPTSPKVLENLFNHLIIIDTSDHIHRAISSGT